MSREVRFAVAVVLISFASLLGWVLVLDYNFSYRDAAHFYYPYWLSIQLHWQQYGVPLWSKLENSGTPIAGNPTAAVFYPPKLIFFLLPYGQAFKWFHALHVLWAIVGTAFAARRLKLGVWPATFAGLAYGLSGFVIFQLYNIVFLVGAAWLPFGLIFGYEFVAYRRQRSALLFALVIALQILGGDPEAAYLLIVSVGFLWLYSRFDWRYASLLIVLILLVGSLQVNRHRWVRALTEVHIPDRVELLAEKPVIHQPPFRPKDAWALHWAILGGFCMGSIAVLWMLRSASSDLKTWLMIAGMSAGLSAIQLAPTAEFASKTDRAAPDGPHEPAAFSFFPLRVVEFFAPSFFGRSMPTAARWFPFYVIEANMWVPDMYMGLSTVVLGLSGLAFRRGDPARRWITWILIISLLFSFGRFCGYKWLADVNKERVKAIDQVGDTHRYGEPDGVYWLADNCLPGFSSFRYPSKGLVFTALALALLAGFGLEQIRSLSRFIHWPALTLAGVSLAGFVIVNILSPTLQKTMPTHSEPFSSFGPFQPKAAVGYLTWSLLHSAILSATLAAICWQATRLRGKLTLLQPILVVLLAVDLVLANRWQIFGESQADIDREPLVLTKIKAHEASLGSTEPYRVHRVKIWEPPRWQVYGEPARLNDLSSWERMTAQPKYALPFGGEYVFTEGTMNLYDYDFFFGPWDVDTPDRVKQSLAKAPKRIIYHPRVSYNLWNAKYFIMPKAVELADEHRGLFTLLGSPDGRVNEIIAESTPEVDDYQITINPEVMPRAWVVHDAEFEREIKNLDRKVRRPIMERLTFRPVDLGERLWPPSKYQTLQEYPYRYRVLLETDEANVLRNFVSHQVPASEPVQFEQYDHRNVRMRIPVSNGPGFLVISDAYYPGWSAKVNGVAVDIIRANRAMRAIPIPAGKDVMVEMSYRSLPFEIGALISGVTWLLLGFMLWRHRPTQG